MEQVLSNDAVVTALIAILVALAGVLVAVIRSVGEAAVAYIRERAGLTAEVRRRSLAEDVVAAVEQMAGRGWSGEQKLQAAMKLARDRGMGLGQEEIEAALKRQQGWLDSWPPRAAEGND